MAEIAAAAITAAAMAFGSHKSSKSSERATDASLSANSEALDYAKQQEERDRAEQKAAWDAYQQQLAPYQAASNNVLNSFNSRMGYNTAPQPRTLADLAGVPQRQEPPAQPALEPGANPYAPIEDDPEKVSPKTIEAVILAMQKYPRRLREMA